MVHIFAGGTGIKIFNSALSTDIKVLYSGLKIYASGIGEAKIPDASFNLDRVEDNYNHVKCANMA